MTTYWIPIALAGAGLLIITEALTATPSDAQTPKKAGRFGAMSVTESPTRTLASSGPSSPDERSSSLTAQPAMTSSWQNELHSGFDAYKKCLTSHRCAYRENDPRDYEIQVYQDMVGLLREFEAWRSAAGVQDRRVNQEMRRFLAVSDAYVKIEALKIIATQPPDPENLAPILDLVIRYSQPEVVPSAIAELARFRDPASRGAIDDVVESTLRSGAVFTSLEIAGNLKPLINSTNSARYQRLAVELERQPLGGEIAAALRESLK